jgi:hypothetical protein
LLLSALLWVFTTTGGRQIFVKEVLGGACDSQAEHFLRGDVDVDVDAIGHEAMIVNGKVRMYFGPFPALLRIPLNFLYPAGHGKWSRISGFFVFRSRQSEGRALTRALLGFSICAGGALLSRVTFGAPFVLIGLFLALGIRRGNRITNLAALILPLGAALIFYIWLSYARFGSFTGVNFDYYINPVHSEFAHKFGVFSPRRIPYSFSDYFSLRFPSLEREPPFLAADRHSYNYPTLYSNDFSEVYLPLPWSSGWLVFGAIMGISCLLRRKRADLFQRGAAVALFVQFLCILSYFLLAERYATDFLLAERYATDLCPFLIFCFIIFLSSGGAALVRSRHVLIGLIVPSTVVNSLATVSWLVDADQNVPPET